MKRLAWSLALAGWLVATAAAAAAQEGPTEDWFQKGYARYVKGDYREAATLFQKAVEAAREDARAHYYLGYSYYMIRQYPASLEAFRQAYALDPAYTPLVPRP